MRELAKSLLALTVLSGFLLCAGAAWAQSHPHPSPTADGDLDRDCYYWRDARVPGAECWTRCPVGTEAANVQSRARYHRHAGLEMTRGRLHICRAKVARYAGRRCYADTEYEAYTPTSTGHGPSYRVLVEDVECRKRTMHAVPRKSFENMKPQRK